MKPSLLLYCLLSFSCCFAQQSGEFGYLDNGLIYPDSTITRLKYIVDSLNIRFRVCEPKVFYTLAQAKAHYFSIEKKRVQQAITDIEQGLTWQQMKAKYPLAKTTEGLLVVKSMFKNWEGQDKLEFEAIDLDTKGEQSLIFDTQFSKYDDIRAGRWVWQYRPRDNYNQETLEAFYFVTDMNSVPLPPKFNAMIQYGECLVDTNQQVFRKEAKGGSWELRQDTSSALSNLIAYTEKLLPPYRVYETSHVDSIEQQIAQKRLSYAIWDSIKKRVVDSLASHDSQFHYLLKRAIDEALQNHSSDAELENLAEAYYDKATALELKRNRQVMGSCSMDQSPRYHALNIARLSAETVKWEIFLRSHLDIMNDRFQRMSDGSYAWQYRKTYIKELEVLDINVHDLLLGISLRVSNPGQNHYYGSIGRIGRALAETKDAAKIESSMLSMISDNSLDDYNRILMYWLFQSYNHNIVDKQKQKGNLSRLKEALNSMPDYIKTALKPAAIN